jgi:transposase, IS6 family
VEISL